MAKPNWQDVQDFVVGIPGSKLSFAKRLARENGWKEDYAKRVIVEYKRFMFLCATHEEGMTPSDQIDQAWHLHLLYTTNYWDEFCATTLGKEISHNPTEGGQEERDKFVKWYERTLEDYRLTFGKRPPADIWPDSKTRFSKDVNAVRIHRARYTAIPTVFFQAIWVAIFVSIVTGLAFEWDWTLVWGVFSIPTMILAHLSTIGRINFPGIQKRDDGGCGCDASCAGCGDGCGGCGD